MPKMKPEENIDKGYAWVILTSCFVIQAILFGIYRAYSIVLSVILKTYSVSRGEATWFLSLCMTVIHLTGPISGILNTHYSVRRIMSTGCLLATLGVALCYFATSVFDIVIFIGIIQGFGIGITYVQMPAIINDYFIKYRATANGIAMSGGTIGAFILCPIIEYVLQILNLDQCFLLIAFITLFSLPAALFLRPMHKIEVVVKVSSEKEKEAEQKVNKATPIKLVNYQEISEDKSKEMHSAQLTTSNNYQTIDNNPNGHSLSHVIHDIKESVERRISFYEENVIPKMKELKVNIEQKERRHIEKMLRIIFNPYFLLIMSTHLAYFWGSLTFQMVVIDDAEDKGISRSMAAQLLTSFSAGDFIGRLGSGWLLDSNCVRNKYLAMVSITFIGVFLEIVANTSNICLLITSSFGLGILSGVIVVLLNSLFCEYIGTKHAALSFGLSSFFCGLATLVRPSVVGYFRDRADGSYDGMFEVFAFVCMISGFIWLIEIFIEWRAKKKMYQSTLDN